MIKFKSNDGKIISIDFDLLSEFMDPDLKHDFKLDEINPLDVNSSTLNLLNEWFKLNKEQNVMREQSSDKRIQSVDKQELKFLTEINGMNLTDLLNVAFRLNIKDLYVKIINIVSNALKQDNAGESQQDEPEDLGRDELDKMEHDEPDVVISDEVD